MVPQNDRQSRKSKHRLPSQGAESTLVTVCEGGQPPDRAKGAPACREQESENDLDWFPLSLRDGNSKQYL